MHPARQAYIEDAKSEDEEEQSYNLSNVPQDYDYEIQTGHGVSEKAAAVYEQFGRKRRLNAIAAPTDDARVKKELRKLGEPITLFAEDRAARRDRLKELLLRRQDAGMEEDGDVVMDSDSAPEEEDTEEFYHRGGDDVTKARLQIADFSLSRARHRLAFQKLESRIPIEAHHKHRDAIKRHLKSLELFGTQRADRPVSITRFSPGGSYVASGNWAGTVKILTIPNLDDHRVLRGHTDRIGGLSWLPGATVPGSQVSPTSVNLASGGGEGNIHLWNLEQDTPIATFRQPKERICRTEFHPSGKYLASASYDRSWHLWDVEQAKELYQQEGHSREVYSVAFNCDGSLMASGGLDAYGRVWDLRTGRNVMLLDGHIKEVFAVDWSTDGHRVMTGSGDGFMKCWDLRKVNYTDNIAAHVGGVTDIRWWKGMDDCFDVSSRPKGSLEEFRARVEAAPRVRHGDYILRSRSGTPEGSGSDHSHDQSGERPTDSDQHPDAMDTSHDGPEARANAIIPKKAGTLLVTTGFDKKIHIWSADDWALVKTLTGHQGNVLSADLSPEARWVVSGSYDRTVKLWAREDLTSLYDI